MPCTHNCRQGRDCYEPWACGNNPYRYVPPVTRDGGQTIHFAERDLPITMEETNDWLLRVAGWALLVVGLPMLVWAIWQIYHGWTW